MKFALMLINSDPKIKSIAHEVALTQKNFADFIESLNAEAVKAKKAVTDFESRATEAVKRRLDEIGLTVLKQKDHTIHVDIDAGVVWVRTEEECDCPFCKLRKAFG